MGFELPGTVESFSQSMLTSSRRGCVKDSRKKLGSFDEGVDLSDSCMTARAR